MAETHYSAEQYDQEISHLSQLLQASSGFERTKLNAQIKDASAARDNAMAIAKLQSGTSLKIAKLGAETQRYGIDIGRQNILDQLKENARQFDATHALDMEKLGIAREEVGLQYADTYAKYASTPDQFFQRADFESAANRAATGLGVTPYGTDQPPAQAKNFGDFAALASWGQGAASGQPAPAAAADPTKPAPTPATPTPGNDTAYASGGAAATSANGAAATTEKDPRVSILTKMLQAMPPSNEAGLSDDDWKVLTAAKSIMSTRTPGSFERLRGDQQKVALAGIRRAGYSSDDWLQDYERNRPNQGSVRAA